jgi:hypothetical protein
VPDCLGEFGVAEGMGASGVDEVDPVVGVIAIARCAVRVGRPASRCGF